MANGCHLEKNGKLLYFSNGLTDLDEILHTGPPNPNVQKINFKVEMCAKPNVQPFGAVVTSPSEY